MEVQTRVRELMAQKSRLEGRKITLRVLSDETGLSMSSVTNWASNSVARFDAKQIITFCDYFGCELHELLVIEPSPEMESLLTAVA